MQIQVNTDKNIEGREELVAHVEATVLKTLSHLSAHITRVEVHLSDANGDKHGPNDKRCMMEARFEGRRPTAVTCAAATMSQAISSSAEKLKNSLGSLLGQLQNHR
ncbi:MAG: hypothetical protein ACI9KE_004031 [Polyangiales bacterium]|jgi:hypothetical protein